MPSSFFRSPHPLVFAHRGGSGLAPENTIAAFDHAAALGVDGIELDVRFSRDGVVMVHHDEDVGRTTDACGRVESMTASELARLDAGFRFGGPDRWPYRGRGIGIPTLADVLRRCRDCRIIIELKLNSRSLAQAALAEVRAADAHDRVCFGSFGLRVLRAVRALDPEVATSAAREEVRWALYRSRFRWPVRRVRYGGYQVPEWAGSTRVVSPRFVRDAHAAALAVQVWTVDEVDEARRLLEWGADALITDRPDRIGPIVRAVRSPAAEPEPNGT